MKSLGFMGLGTMGYPMAAHLKRAGYDVVVYNRSVGKAERWGRETGGLKVDSLPEMVTGREVVLTCLGNDDDVRDVYLGEKGLLANAGAGTVFIDHTTTSAVLARELAAEAAHLRCEFLDAPVSGGQIGAERAQLSVMVGGPEPVFERVRPILEVYAKTLTYQGASGSGQLCKMVNQICITGVLQGLSEALVFAEHSGLDLAAVKNAIAAGAAGSWQLQNRWESMHARKFDFGFAVDWMRKDLAFCLEEGRKQGVRLPGVEQVDERYRCLQACGEGRSDTLVLIKQFDIDDKDEA